MNSFKSQLEIAKSVRIQSIVENLIRNLLEIKIQSVVKKFN